MIRHLQKTNEKKNKNLYLYIIKDRCDQISSQKNEK